MAKRKTKKPDDGLCAFKYDMEVRIPQDLARTIAMGGGLPKEVGEKLKAAIDDHVMMDSDVFRAYFSDPPLSVNHTGNRAEFTAAGREWTMTTADFKRLSEIVAEIHAASRGL